MVLRRSVLVITFLFILMGCSESNQLRIQELNFYKKSNVACQDLQCTEATIVVPFAEQGVGAVADSINFKVFQEISKIVSFDHTPSYEDGYESIVDSFIKSYDALKKEFPKEGSPWEANVKAQVLMDTPRLFSIGITHYVFSGGAHGYKGNQVLHFNPISGAVYSLDDIFIDRVGLSALVEAKLRNKWGISQDAPINSTGLMFENNVFTLPENIFIYPDHVVAFYNIYEIASYADGPTEIHLTYDEVRPFMIALE